MTLGSNHTCPAVASLPSFMVLLFTQPPRRPLSSQLSERQSTALSVHLSVSVCVYLLTRPLTCLIWAPITCLVGRPSPPSSPAHPSTHPPTPAIHPPVHLSTITHTRLPSVQTATAPSCPSSRPLVCIHPPTRLSIRVPSVHMYTQPSRGCPQQGEG